MNKYMNAHTPQCIVLYIRESNTGSDHISTHCVCARARVYVCVCVCVRVCVRAAGMHVCVCMCVSCVCVYEGVDG